MPARLEDGRAAVPRRQKKPVAKPTAKPQPLNQTRHITQGVLGTQRHSPVSSGNQGNKSAGQKYALPKGPRGDAPQTRKKDTAKAESFKQTAAYRGAVRAAYKTNPTKNRSARVDRAERTSTVEGRAILHTHNAEVRRNNVLKAGAAGFTGMSNADRDRAETFKATDTYKSALGAARKARERDTPQGKPKTGGFAGIERSVVSNFLRDRTGPFGQFVAPIVSATLERPDRVAANTLHSIPGTAKGTVGGLAQLVANPLSVKDLPGGMAKDYSRRYGGDSDKQIERIKKEGALPEILDATIAVGGTGSIVGRGLGAVAKTGKLGAKAEELMTTARPALRVRGGDAGAVAQDASPNLVTRRVQKARDARRTKKADERIAAGEHTLRPGQGEVVKTRRGRITGGQKADEKGGVAAVLARNFVGTRAHQARELVQGVAKERRQAKDGLSKAERDAFDALEPFGLRGLVDYRESGLKTLDTYEAHVKAKREADVPDVILENSDALKAIEKIREHHGDSAIDNGKVAAALEQFHHQQVTRAKRLEARSQVRAPESAEARRHAPAARVLDEEYRKDLADNEAIPSRWKAEEKRLENDVADVKTAKQSAKVGEAFARGEVKAPAARADRQARAADPDYAKQAAKVRRSRAEVKAAKVDYRNTQRRHHEGGSSEKATKDIERATTRLRAAEAVHEAQRKALKEITAQTERRATLISGMGARAGTTSATRMGPFGPRGQRIVDPVEEAAARHPLAGLGRKPKGPLSRLEKARGRQADIDSRLADAEKALKEHRANKPTEETIRQHRQEADRRMVERSKKRLGDQPEPVYVMDRPFATRGFGDHAPGGTRAMVGDKQWSGGLFERGLMDTSAGAYDQGLARSIKREHQWNAYTDLIERNRIANPKTDDGLFRDKREAEIWMRDQGMNPDELRLVNVTRMREVRDAELDAHDRPGQAQESPLSDTSGLKDALDVARPQRVGKDAQPTHTVAGHEAGFSAAQKWAVVTKNAADEMQAQAEPSGTGLRLVGKAQGFSSRTILSTNPLYVPQNTLSNLIASAASTRPDRLLSRAGNRWYHKLDPESRAFIDEWAGIHSSAFDASVSPRMGASAGPFANIRDSYAAFVDSDIMAKARRGHLNVFQWNHHLDEKQNGIFRKEVFYDTMRRKARDNITVEVNGVVRDMGTLMDVLKLPDGHPDKLAALRAAEPDMERMANRVDSILGNWTKFTAMERKGLKSAFLFYGFLRYATKLTFYTLPIKHPILTAMILKLGQLHNEEIVDILGDQFFEQYANGRDKDGQLIHPAKTYSRQQIEDGIRSQMLNQVGARIFWQNEKGELRSVDAAKINPFVGPVMDFLDSPTKAGFGLMSPILQTWFNYGLGEDPSYHVPVNLSGKMTAYKETPDKKLSSFAGYNLRQNLLTSPLVRAADAALTDPNVKQADDSIPLLGSDPIRTVSNSEANKVQRDQRDKLGATSILGVRVPTGVSRAAGTTALSPYAPSNDKVMSRVEATTYRQVTKGIEAKKRALKLAKKDRFQIPGSTKTYEAPAMTKLKADQKLYDDAHKIIQGQVDAERLAEAPKSDRDKILEKVRELSGPDASTELRKKIQKSIQDSKNKIAERRWVNR